MIALPSMLSVHVSAYKLSNYNVGIFLGAQMSNLNHRNNYEK